MKSCGQEKKERKVAKWIATAVLALLPAVVLAQGGSFNPPIGAQSFAEILVNLVKFLLGLVALVALVGILWGAFLYMTAGGSDDRMRQAKTAITYAVLGLIIAIAALIIVTSVFEALGGGGGGIGIPGGGGGLNIPGGGGGTSIPGGGGRVEL
jgi:cytochrome bd-type quinol oxidase subunit 2